MEGKCITAIVLAELQNGLEKSVILFFSDPSLPNHPFFCAAAGSVVWEAAVHDLMTSGFVGVE
jgi:hypothetical protein